jgi:YggT family protein
MSLLTRGLFFKDGTKNHDINKNDSKMLPILKYPSMLKPILLYSIHLFFLSYTILLCLRVISSWFPLEWRGHRFVHFLSFYTDPFLNVFRALIPPLGGVLDLSPILAFLALKLLEMFSISVVQWF